jgi:hypothetical protein
MCKAIRDDGLLICSGTCTKDCCSHCCWAQQEMRENKLRGPWTFPYIPLRRDSDCKRLRNTKDEGS